MQFSITKSGLEIFDTCRAWGLGYLLYAAGQGKDSPVIGDSGASFVITAELDSARFDLKRSDQWRALKADENWQNVFLTYKRKWTGQRDEALAIIETNVRTIFDPSSADLTANLDGDATLPGPLDPAAFKGLRGLTSGDYREKQTCVDEINWALGCFGAVVAQKYKLQRVAGKWEYYVTLPVPERVRMDDFREIRELVGNRANLNYPGARVAAAHYAVLLADSVRERAQSRHGLEATFSKLHYFSLFRSGQQLKPAGGGAVSVAPLIAIALERPAAAYDTFLTWDYLFRRGSVKGCDDLAHVVTELVVDPSPDTYYRHARIFARYIFDANKRVKNDKLYSEDAIKEVMHYVEP